MLDEVEFQLNAEISLSDPLDRISKFTSSICKRKQPIFFVYFSTVIIIPSILNVLEGLTKELRESF